VSYYYANAWNRQDKRKHRHYLKVSIAIDTNSQYQNKELLLINLIGGI